MKKFMFTLALILCSVMFVNAASNEVYFTSKNGVELTKKEYDLFVEMYGEDIIDNLTQEKYDIVSRLDVNNNEVEIVVYEDKFNEFANPGISLYATYVETTYKRLSISKSCNDNGYCVIVVALRWKAIPTVKSYDVIGARYNGLIKVQTNAILTQVEYEDGFQNYNNYKIEDNGHGCTFKLRTDSDIVSVTQSFSAHNSGKIFASYQHATEYITFNESQDYEFGSSGYGNVFEFGNSIFGVYDGMNGVYVTM